MTSSGHAPIDPAALAVVTAPFGESKTLPPRAYTDDAVLNWELTHFFDASWIALARSEDVASPGDQRAVRLGAESVILTRDRGGTLHAFSTYAATGATNSWSQVRRATSASSAARTTRGSMTLMAR